MAHSLKQIPVTFRSEFLFFQIKFMNTAKQKTHIMRKASRNCIIPFSDTKHFIDLYHGENKTSFLHVARERRKQFPVSIVITSTVDYEVPKFNV